MAGSRHVLRFAARRRVVAGLAVVAVTAGGLWSASADATTTSTAKIGDRVWVDADGQGDQDAGEQGLAGVTVQLWTVPEKVLVSSKVTVSGGWYSFTGLQTNRCYRLKVVIPNGYKATKQDATVDTADSDINTEGSMPKWVCPGWGSVVRTSWDAGLTKQSSVDPLPPAVITGLFFEDLNGNRTLDPGEPGVSGVKAILWWGPSDICSGPPFAGENCVVETLGESAPSGSDGRFRFELDFNGRPDTFGCHNIQINAKVVDSALLFSEVRPLSDSTQLAFEAQNGQGTAVFPCFHAGETWETEPAPLMRPAP